MLDDDFCIKTTNEDTTVSVKSQKHLSLANKSKRKERKSFDIGINHSAIG